MTEMTNLIDPEIPSEVLKFTSVEEFNDIDELYKILRSAYDVFVEDYTKFPNPYATSVSISTTYNEDRGRFYSKYIKFAQKCAEMEKEFNDVEHHGIADVIKNIYNRNDINSKIREIYSSVDYNFPYSWKFYV